MFDHCELQQHSSPSFTWELAASYDMPWSCCEVNFATTSILFPLHRIWNPGPFLWWSNFISQSIRTVCSCSNKMRQHIEYALDLISLVHTTTLSWTTERFFTLVFGDKPRSSTDALRGKELLNPPCSPRQTLNMRPTLCRRCLNFRRPSSDPLGLTWVPYWALMGNQIKSRKLHHRRRRGKQNDSSANFMQQAENSLYQCLGFFRENLAY
jgi:hypothetical protein